MEKDRINKLLKSVSSEEVDAIYLFLESILTNLSLEDMESWEIILKTLDTKKLNDDL